jgi:fatty acid desaturase
MEPAGNDHAGSRPGATELAGIALQTAPAVPGPRPTTLSPDDADYLELSRRVRMAGLLDRCPRAGLGRVALQGLALAVGVATIVWVGNSWWQLATAAVLAVLSGQLAFSSHDVGHGQGGRSRPANDLLGLVMANGLVGVSFGWWIDKHNRHHGHPNQQDRDPDIGTGVFVWTPEQGRRRQGLGRRLARHQAAFFFPMAALEALHLHVASALALPQRRPGRRSVEGALLGAHLVLGLGLLLAVMSPVKALVFVAVHQGLLGLQLGSAFAPNHKGMPVFAADEKPSFVQRQVITSRNIRGGWLIDFALGGLNHQIEHHLFPAMPRANLRRCRPIVRDFCAERGLPYEEVSLLTSYARVLRSLRLAGAGGPPLQSGV